MGHGAISVFTKSMVSANSLVTFDLQRAWTKVYVQVPTFASTTALDLYLAATSSSTFYQLGKDIPNTTTVQAWSFTIAASTTANGRMVPIPGGFQYFRIFTADSAPTAAVDFKVICSD